MILRGRALDVGFATLAAAQLGAAAWLTPAGNAVALPDGTSIGGMCLFRAALHIDCPFCGMTRSFVALAHGDLASAIRFHPAGPLLFVAMIALVVAVVTVAIRRARPLFDRQQFVMALQSVVVVCFVIGVYKMVRS